MTYREACERCAAILNAAHHNLTSFPLLEPLKYPYTGRAIWELSPTGELWPVVEFCDLAEELVLRGHVTEEDIQRNMEASA